ncbi:MAG: diacylglycerol kinase family lipid kinase [Gemmatimonadetes bacterium]|nr:diacylglycerol kinase family lipid kinase [Gemmatimonadota bacterium]
MTSVTRSPDVRLVINPRAGGGRALRVRDRLEHALSRRGLRPAVSLTTGPGHAVRIAQQSLLDGERVIVAVGGDGTVHEVANGMLRAAGSRAIEEAALAVVPVGTGNDFAKLLGVYGSIDAALDAIADGPVQRLDAGLAEWEGGSAYFVNAMGTGIDVEVIRQIARHQPLPGALNYVAGLIRALARYRPVAITVRTETSTFDGRIMTIAVANGRSIGGTFQICPAARADDGLFDVCIIRELPLFASLRTAARIVRGTHTALDGVTVLRGACTDIWVAPDTPFFFQLDGELHEPPGVRFVRLTLRPGVLPVRTARPSV